MKKKVQIWLNVAIVLVLVAAFVVQAPNINPLYPSGAFIWCCVISAFLFVNFIMGLGGLHFVQGANGHYRIDTSELKGFGKKALIIVIVIWAAYFLLNIVSSPIFNYWAYRDQLGTASEQTAFSQDIQPIDLNQIPIVDKDLASRLADKKLGEKTSLGSMVYLGEPVIQKVNGKLVWVVPLHHSGFFKWLSNMSGTPGYIMVSATDMQDVKYVDGHNIKYQPDNYLFDDLNRHIRICGGAFEGLIDYTFEINDEGRPYWVVTTYRNNWLFALPEATGVLIVDAENGQMEKYSLANLPEWVDRVQPEDTIMNQINNQGEYVHGFLNFANKDKYRVSTGNIIVYNNDRCYLFTGLTSVGNDESAIGFILVDMVTKESKIYYMSGATEEAAMGSAEGKLQQYGYRASFPLIINMEGKATYFMPMKDDSKLIKQYAFVSVEDFTKVGTGETISDAKNNYLQLLRSSGTAMVEGENKDISGTVSRFASEQTAAGSRYKLILEEQPETIYTISYEVSDELALTKEGDRVKITYVEGDGQVTDGTEFDNLSIPNS